MEGRGGEMDSFPNSFARPEGWGSSSGCLRFLDKDGDPATIGFAESFMPWTNYSQARTSDSRAYIRSIEFSTSFGLLEPDMAFKAL